ncbi:DUF177 domain-containing protein [Nereida sp. MMG025]|uniref:YceD family protein n=1 Tax=Nereida sp. MMG025 TaxID=2909981 RepID=UPI001F39A196|nr:DUF177 domain-containing protein [Nereida sp. MMG025]MCF6443524.1 DUF177 domain-containing protein [Nereida sp. MMG025]
MTSAPTRLRLADLASRKPTRFNIAPTGAALAALQEMFEVDDLRKLRFEGHISPQGKRNWFLSAHLGATVVQPCVSTFAPVTTRIEEEVERLYTDTPPEVEDASEIEMPEDDRIEALPEEIDLMAILSEALALAIPAFPRAEDAPAVEISVTEPGKEAMTDDDAKPFAGLADLLKKSDET